MSRVSNELKPAMDYWCDLAKDDVIGPSWREFDLLKLPPTMLPAVIVVDVDHARSDLLYRYFGSQIAEVFGADHTGKNFSQLSAPYITVSRETYDWVLEDKMPVSLILEFSRVKATTQVMETLRLPLSDNGVEVTNILSVARFFSDRRKLNRMLEGGD